MLKNRIKDVKKEDVKKNRIKEGRIELMNQGLLSNELKTEETMKKINKHSHARIFSRSKIQKQWESSLQKGSKKEASAEQVFNRFLLTK